MEPSQSQNPNPWFLHLQKLGLELKCPHCLNLLHQPLLLPCNHILCNSCLSGSADSASECPVCKHQYRETRQAPFIENIVTIYRSMDTMFTATYLQSASSVRASGQCPISAKTVVDDKIQNEDLETTQEGNSSHANSIFSPTASKSFTDCVEAGTKVPKETAKQNEIIVFDEEDNSTGNVHKPTRKRRLQNDSNLENSDNVNRCMAEAKCQEHDLKKQKISDSKLVPEFGQPIIVSDPVNVTTHNKVKFPRERRKSKPSNISSSPCGAKEWVFWGSDLSAKEMCCLMDFASNYDATVSCDWKPNVTHVIVSTNEKGACKSTLKILKAILSGRWVLSMEWVKACIAAKEPVDEQPYVVKLDIHGTRDGPKTGRLGASRNWPILFQNLKFFFSGDFEPSYKADLIDLVNTAGGTVIMNRENLVSQNCDSQSSASSVLVVYNCDPSPHASQGRSVILHRIEEAEKLANEIGSRVIMHTWILDSIIYNCPSTVRASGQCPISAKTVVDDKIQNEDLETNQQGNSIHGNSIFSPTASKSLSDCVEAGTMVPEETAKQNEKFVFDGDDNSSENVQKTTRRRLQNGSNLENNDNVNRCMAEAKCLEQDQNRQKISDSNDNGSKLPQHKRKAPKCKLAPESDQPTVVSDPVNVNRSACGFCHSSKVTDETGQMLHFVNGKEVGDVGTTPNAIHVHRKCIEWTPQVYHKGEKIMNLESEVARAAKLSCSYRNCGKKGAALGCFVKSCRKSYHAPCALKVDCRWDGDDFLILCPAHNKVKFPRERRKSKPSNIWSSPCGAKEWVFCGSDLSAKEMCCLIDFASNYDAMVSCHWKPNVTHVIVSTNEKGACKRTMKVLNAILSGGWVLSMEWVKSCIAAKEPVDEEPYEVNLDIHGICDGPKTGRHRASKNEPKLFHNLKFFFSGDFEPSYKTDLIDLVNIARGTVIMNREELVSQNCDSQSTSSTVLVVYNCDSSQLASQGRSVILRRIEEAEKLANEIGSRIIMHTWILDSVAACKLHPAM